MGVRRVSKWCGCWFHSRGRELRTRTGWLARRTSRSLCPSLPIFKGNGPLTRLTWLSPWPGHSFLSAAHWEGDEADCCVLLQGKQPRNRSGGNPRWQKTKVPGPTEEDGLVFLSSEGWSHSSQEWKQAIITDEWYSVTQFNLQSELRRHVCTSEGLSGSSLSTPVPQYALPLSGRNQTGQTAKNEPNGATRLGFDVEFSCDTCNSCPLHVLYVFILTVFLSEQRHHLVSHPILVALSLKKNTNRNGLNWRSLQTVIFAFVDWKVTDVTGSAAPHTMSCTSVGFLSYLFKQISLLSVMSSFAVIWPKVPTFTTKHT